MDHADVDPDSRAFCYLLTLPHLSYRPIPCPEVNEHHTDWSFPGDSVVAFVAEASDKIDLPNDHFRSITAVEGLNVIAIATYILVRLGLHPCWKETLNRAHQVVSICDSLHRLHKSRSMAKCRAVPSQSVRRALKFHAKRGLIFIVVETI